MAKISEKAVTQVITDVDILVAPAPQQAQAPAGPMASIKDFLKLALPSIPKAQAPMEVRAPEIQKTLMEVQPRLQDQGRLRLSKMEALELGARRTELAKVEQAMAQRDIKAPMELPKLEEVGVRQASKKVIEMAALEERQERLRPVGLAPLAAGPEPRRQVVAAAPALPHEAAGSGSPGRLSKIADLLTSEAPSVTLEPKTMPSRLPQALNTSAPAASPKADLQQIQKKSVEIEGPLSNRKVLSYSIPKFPEWARELNITESLVAIRFYVNAQGLVLEDMKVERTSGFGRLDRLAMEHLKLWRFAPLASGSGNEWGVITFRFILE